MSVASEAAQMLRPLGVEGATVALRMILSKFTTVELAALATRFSFWARSSQLPPVAYRTWTQLCARGAGKTMAAASHINAEVQAGRAMLIGLAAQDEESSIAIQVMGPSGLIATAHPLNRPEWQATAKRLRWPNGALAYVRTPEVPGKIRGLEYHLSWLSEVQSWPVATRQEAYDNFLFSTRLGLARILVDATPKRRHPILRQLLAEHAANPVDHPVSRGTTRDNRAFLGAGYVEELERRYGQTSRGREELLGEMLAESESALVRQEWIDLARRPLPSTFARRVISVDVAVTSRAGSDRSGIIEAGLGVDGMLHVIADRTGKHAPSAWAKIVLDAYSSGADCVICEINKGGDLVTENLRAAAKDRGLAVVVLGKKENPRHVAGTVFVREVFARGSKEDRAQPLATAYERGRVSHVIGADLAALEDILTTWEPTPGHRSPDALDALTHAATELILGDAPPDPRLAFEGFAALAAAVAAPTAALAAAVAAPTQWSAPTDLAALLGGRGGGGGRI